MTDEMSAFVMKFNQLKNDGHKAFIWLECQAGQTLVTLQVHLLPAVAKPTEDPSHSHFRPREAYHHPREGPHVHRSRYHHDRQTREQPSRRRRREARALAAANRRLVSFPVSPPSNDINGPTAKETETADQAVPVPPPPPHHNRQRPTAEEVHPPLDPQVVEAADKAALASPSRLPRHDDPTPVQEILHPQCRQETEVSPTWPSQETDRAEQAAPVLPPPHNSQHPIAEEVHPPLDPKVVEAADKAVLASPSHLPRHDDPSPAWPSYYQPSDVVPFQELDPSPPPHHDTPHHAALERVLPPPQSPQDLSSDEAAVFKTPLNKTRRRNILRSQAISPETKSLLVSPSFLAPTLACDQILNIDLWAGIGDQSVKDIMGGSDMIEKLSDMISDPSTILVNLGDPEVLERLWILKEEGLCFINYA